MSDFLTNLERTEAYEHGRTQARLDNARRALQRIADQAASRKSLALISATAKIGLQDSEERP